MLKLRVVMNLVVQKLYVFVEEFKLMTIDRANAPALPTNSSRLSGKRLTI